MTAMKKIQWLIGGASIMMTLFWICTLSDLMSQFPYSGLRCGEECDDGLYQKVQADCSDC